MSRLRGILNEAGFEPKPTGKKALWNLHKPQVIDNKDPKLGGKGDDPAGNVKVHNRKPREGYMSGEDEKAYHPPGPGQFDQGRKGLVSTSVPVVTAQEAWPDGRYMQPVSDPNPAGGWPMRRKLQECQR
jgi:hypothetical protein